MAIQVRNKRYRVKAGQNWASIAKQYDLSEEDLLQANPGIRRIYPGSRIKIPPAPGPNGYSYFGGPVPPRGGPDAPAYFGGPVPPAGDLSAPPDGIENAPEGELLTGRARFQIPEGGSAYSERIYGMRPPNNNLRRRQPVIAPPSANAPEAVSTMGTTSMATTSVNPYSLYRPFTGSPATTSGSRSSGNRNRPGARPVGMGDLRALERQQANQQRERNRRRQQPGMGDLRAYEAYQRGQAPRPRNVPSVGTGYDPYAYDQDVIFGDRINDPMALAVGDTRSPTQLPDTFLQGLLRTATHTMAELQAGLRPATISLGDQFFLRISDEQMAALGYVKQPHGGWIRTNEGFQQSGQGGYGGGGGRGGRGGTRRIGQSGGRGGGEDTPQVYAGNYGGRVLGAGGGGYSPTGRYLGPASMGSVSWRGL